MHVTLPPGLCLPGGIPAPSVLRSEQQQTVSTLRCPSIKFSLQSGTLAIGYRKWIAKSPNQVKSNENGLWLGSVLFFLSFEKISLSHLIIISYVQKLPNYIFKQETQENKFKKMLCQSSG